MLIAIIAMPAASVRWNGERTSSAPIAEPAKTASNNLPELASSSRQSAASAGRPLPSSVRPMPVTSSIA
jgi:hypothetical protein